MSISCAGCNCRDCYNSGGHDEERQEAIKATLDKNPHAFQAKITKDSEHSSGCHCKKSHCLKKYCECFEAAVYCSDKCKCLECDNFEGSSALMLRKAKIRDGRKVAQPFFSNPKTGQAPLSVQALGSSVKLEHDLDDEANTGNGTGIVQEQRSALPPRLSSLRASSRATRAAPAIMPRLMSTLAGTLVLAGDDTKAKRRPPLIENPMAYVLSCGPDTRAAVIGAFHFLTDGDLHSASLVCKVWMDAAFDPALWEYEDTPSQELLI